MLDQILAVLRAPPVPVMKAATPKFYRSAITAADVLAAPGALTLAHTHTEGDLANVAHYVNVVAVNGYGRTTISNGSATTVTPDAGDSITITFTDVTGASHYDIYCSIDTDPKFAGRITQAQKTAGVDIKTGYVIASPGASTTAGQIDVWNVGAGLQAGATAAQNTAYNLTSIPSIDCTGYRYCDFDLTFSHKDAPDTSSVNPSLVVLPAFLNSRQSAWKMGVPQSIAIGGQGGGYESLQQTVRVEARGRKVVLLVAQMGGLSASLNIDYVLS